MHLRTHWVTFLLSFTLILGACSGGQNPTDLIEENPSLPAVSIFANHPKAMAPSISCSSDSCFLIWLEPQITGYAILQATWLEKKGKWSVPVKRMAHPDLMANAHDTPGMVDGGLIWWHENSAAGKYKYNLRILNPDNSISALHPDLPAGEHSFASGCGLGKGQSAFAWLQNLPLPNDSSAQATQLCFRTYPSTTESAIEVVDDMVCDCCPTDMAATQDGLVLAYRDKSEQSFRDIQVRRRVNGAWEAPVSVDTAHWKIDGCPVNGPAIAAHGNHVDVLWFDGSTTPPSLKTNSSSDGGKSFGLPRKLPVANPIGQVDIAMDSLQTVAVWLAEDPSTGDVKVIASALNNNAFQPMLEGKVDIGAPAFRPRIALVSGVAMITWAENGIRCVRLPSLSPN